MDALVLMERLGGEILANKIRANINGEIVVLAALDEENQWEYTEQGQELANEHSNLAVEESAKPARASKKGLAAVESAPAVEETPAAE